MTTFRWITEPLPAGITVRQVYGFCFDSTGRVLLREDGGRYGLPGGRPEAGEDALATLSRECEEESQITIADPLYLGYQEVTEDGQPPYAQLRYAARITGFHPRHEDPDTGRTYGRLLTPLHKAPALLDWGIDGLLQAASAVHAARTLGLVPTSVRKDTWHN
ncbi:NUDIX hydrolase [Streptomyces sp. AK02-01A]|uniref:NUDIX hydrolase n=1 Tax=Streptomyces sp. AK02-01A TaxID=3028648 RepID=UPI0029A44009|nr:NUDIX hydrolase [Streptomyces sp. AK02-01A]MDX3854219.1 NUDIX hydrolase [Streptomyces sp. AK02-01A]